MHVRLDREAGRPRFLTDTNGKRKGKIMQVNDKKEGNIRAERRKRTTAEVSLYFELPYLLCSSRTRTQPLICVRCSVHYWVSCAINKGGFFEIAFVIVVDTHLPHFEALPYVLPHFDALTQSTNPFRLCIRKYHVTACDQYYALL